MDEIPRSVGPLTKVSLRMDLVYRDGAQTRLQQVPLSFIFGIGRTGLTPFESALYGKQTNDIFSMDVAGECLSSFFGHLCGEFEGSPTTLVAFDVPVNRIDATITDLAPVEGRELVKALAGLSDGCGGGCGCGC